MHNTPFTHTWIIISFPRQIMTGIKYLIITLPTDAAYIIYILPGDPEWFTTSGATCHKLINIL